MSKAVTQKIADKVKEVEKAADQKIIEKPKVAEKVVVEKETEAKLPSKESYRMSPYRYSDKYRWM